MGTLLRRLKFLLKHNYWRVVALVGCLLEAMAAALWQYSAFWAGTLAGIGGSVLATVVVNWVGPTGEEVYQRFLQLGVIDFYSNRSQFRRWVAWLGEARHRCVLLGIAHGGWCRDAGFPPALRDRLQSGVQVQMYFLSPNSPSADVRAKEDSTQGRETIHQIRWSIKFMWDLRQTLGADSRDRLRLYVYDATPSLGVTWIDDSMLVTHYLAGFINLTSPALMVKPSWPEADTLYAVYENNVSRLKERATEVTEQNVDAYTQL